MIKKIEEVFDLPSMESEVNSSYPSDQEEQTTGLDLDKMQRQLEVADKIDAALPMVRDLEQLDADMDKYADKAMHAFQDLMDLGAKKMRKVQKDRSGLNSRKVHWKKLDRGYALVPKEDYKHYGKETFRGGKWWKNGNAWFFTDNARERYIAQYGKTTTSKTK